MRPPLTRATPPRATTRRRLASAWPAAATQTNARQPAAAPARITNQDGWLDASASELSRHVQSARFRSTRARLIGVGGPPQPQLISERPRTRLTPIATA